MPIATSKILPVFQRKRESLTSLADRAIKVHQKTDTTFSTTALYCLDGCLFLEGLQDEQLRQQLREVTYIVLYVTLRQAIHLFMEETHDGSESCSPIFHPTPSRRQDVGGGDDWALDYDIVEGVSKMDGFCLLEILLNEQQQPQGQTNQLLRADQNLITPASIGRKNSALQQMHANWSLQQRLRPSWGALIRPKPNKRKNSFFFNLRQKLSVIQHRTFCLKTVRRRWLKIYSLICFLVY